MFPATSTTDLNSAYFSQRMRQILVTYPLSHNSSFRGQLLEYAIFRHYPKPLPKNKTCSSYFMIVPYFIPAVSLPSAVA